MAGRGARAPSDVSGDGEPVSLGAFAHGSSGSDTDEEGDTDLLDLIGQHNLSVELATARAQRDMAAAGGGGAGAEARDRRVSGARAVLPPLAASPAKRRSSNSAAPPLASLDGAYTPLDKPALGAPPAARAADEAYGATEAPSKVDAGPRSPERPDSAEARGQEVRFKGEYDVGAPAHREAGAATAVASGYNGAQAGYGGAVSYDATGAAAPGPTQNDYGAAYKDDPRSPAHFNAPGYEAPKNMTSVTSAYSMRGSSRVTPSEAHLQMAMAKQGKGKHDPYAKRRSGGLSPLQMCVAVCVGIAAIVGAVFGGMLIERMSREDAPAGVTKTITLIEERNVTNNITTVVVERLPTPKALAAAKVNALKARVTSDGKLKLDISAVADFPNSPQAQSTKQLIATSLGQTSGELDLGDVQATVVETTAADGTTLYSTVLQGQTKFQNVDVAVTANISSVNGEVVVVMVGRPTGEVNLADALGGGSSGGDSGGGAVTAGSGFNASSVKFNAGVVMVFTNGANGTVAGLTIIASIDVGGDARLNTVLQMGASAARRRRLQRRLRLLLDHGDYEGAPHRQLQESGDSLTFEGSLKPGLNLKAPVDMTVNVRASLPSENPAAEEPGAPYINGSLVNPMVAMTDEADTYLLTGTMLFHLLGHGASHPMAVEVAGKLYTQSFELSGALPYWRGGTDGHGTLFQNITVHLRGARLDLSSNGDGAVETAAIAELTAVVDLGVQRLNLRWPLTIDGQPSEGNPSAIGTA